MLLFHCEYKAYRGIKLILYYGTHFGDFRFTTQTERTHYKWDILADADRFLLSPVSFLHKIFIGSGFLSVSKGKRFEVQPMYIDMGDSSDTGDRGHIASWQWWLLCLVCVSGHRSLWLCLSALEGER